MKNFISTLILILFILSNVQAQTEQERTEEYAIVEVMETGKFKQIRVCVDEEESEWIAEKTSSNNDLSPLLRTLGELNAKGFEVVNMTHAASNNTYILLMVKRKK
jgi:hypothetical protein